MLLQEKLIMRVNCNHLLASQIAVNKTELFSSEQIKRGI